MDYLKDRPRVFLSYARSDGEAIATELRKRLQEKEPEITLWQDRICLEGGISWWKQISEALDVVKFLVLVITPNALKSPIIEKEWRYARERGVCVYPVKGVPDKDLAFSRLPLWMRKSQFFD
ncbi:MAG: TIR domain-containing protein [Nitrospirales bacterium]|nr:TIR domain-containing protein [Nitrospirales bacterium]NKB80340.1 TIR domain-containing protein [Nitrospirales bacterium]